MAFKFHSFTKLALKFSNLIYKHFRNPKRNIQKNFVSEYGFQTCKSLGQRSDLESQVLLFHLETALLRSSSLFPYFMLVAFEAGSLIRALILFLLYPFLSLCNEDSVLKVMVMVCFLGLKKDRFRAGRAVLPKYFLEDVGKESFEILRRGKKIIAVTHLPRVMVESFLLDYLNVDVVVGRELKVCCGYYVGLMEERREVLPDKLFKDVESSSCVVGFSSFKKSIDCQSFLKCKEIYLVSEKERRNWNQLPRSLYPKPLIFHDGRLAFRPTYLATLAMFMWLPIGIVLAIFRLLVVLSLPFEIKCPILHFTGIQLRILKPKNSASLPMENEKRILYVCNHKTLLDPLMLYYCLKAPLTAVTYSLSSITEFISPMKTVRLTRDRDQDAKLMDKLLSQGDLVICPEGTTCREPYLLRFSPLFSEMSENIMPVAMDCHVSMFYGTTTSGFKCLDSLFFLMNPRPSYSVRFLDMVRRDTDENGDDIDNSKFKIANLVQNQIGNELGFSCTNLTRKDKYLFLAGNEGRV